MLTASVVIVTLINIYIIRATNMLSYTDYQYITGLMLTVDYNTDFSSFPLDTHDL